MLDKAKIIELVANLNLPNNEYWLSAGAGLVLHGVKEFTQDIDIGCTTKLIEMLLHDNLPLLFASDGTRKTKLGDSIEFFENWYADEVEIIDGISVASLLSIRKHKAALGREKDLQDIVLIDSYVSN